MGSKRPDLGWISMPARQAFRVPMIPAMFLLDREMRIVDRWMGRIDARKVAAAIERCITAKGAGG